MKSQTALSPLKESKRREGRSEDAARCLAGHGRGDRAGAVGSERECPAASARSCPFPFLTGTEKKKTLEGEGYLSNNYNQNILPSPPSPPPLGLPPPPPQAQRGRPEHPDSLQEAGNVGSKAFYSRVIFLSVFFFKGGKPGGGQSDTHTTCLHTLTKADAL